jgi:ubiquitin-conjugating enzyme E2 I
LTLKFSENYPASSPIAVFTPPLPHPNVFASGSVCLSIISHDWKPAITIKQILVGIQELMCDPNPRSPANHEMYCLYKEKRAQYETNARAFAARFKATQ